MEAENPKVKQKTPQTKPKSRAAKLSKEQVLMALQKKKQCNARAQKIVEKLLDPVPSEKIKYFLSNLMHINQSHYDDIVEERAIIKLCGYPFCSEKLRDMPKKQYQISTVHNKVYDITERKNFCSNNCYKSSIFLKEQVLTSPLWVRKEEDIIPDFKLLSLDAKNVEKRKEDEILIIGKELKDIDKETKESQGSPQRRYK